MKNIFWMVTASILALVMQVPTARANCTLYPNLCNLPVQSTTEQPDLDVAIDVVLVGDGFVDMNAWHTSAANAVARFKSQTATGIYQTTLFNFHVVDVVSATTNVSNTDTTDTALGGTTATLLRVNDGKANVAALNAPDVDVVVVILNGSGRANANYPSQLTSGGAMRLSTDPNPISHEMGHALFNLADEYVETCTNPNESVMLRNRNVTATAGCAKFSTTPGAGCVEGGMYCSTGVWRSASSCLMRASGNASTCPVCQRTIAEMLLEKRSGVDVSEPWAVLSNPANGATVSGVVNLTAPSFDDFLPPTRVAFTVDGIYVGDAVTPASSVPFDVGGLANGTHTLAVYMEDTFGHARHGLDTTFTTSNAPSAATLTLAITSPAANSTHNNSVYVSGTLAGGTASWTALLVDGAVVMVNGRSGPGGVGFNWDGSAAADGAHTLQLQGANDLGAVFSSAVVNITLTHNAGGGPGGGSSGQLEGGAFVGINQPAQWDTVTSLTMVRVNTFGFARPAALTLKLDGVPVTPNPLPALTSPTVNDAAAFVDTSGWSAGPHYLEVTADDGAQSNTSMAVPVVKAAVTLPEAFLFTVPGGSYVRDTVSIRLAAVVAAGAPSTRVLLDGVELFASNQAQANYSWNTTTATPGGHQLLAVVTDGAGNTGISEPLFVQVDNTPPTVSIRAPLQGATLPPGLVLVQDQNADLGSYVTGRDLFVDNVLVQSAGYQALFAVLAAGSHTLRVRVTDAVGHSTDSAVVTVNVASCQSSGCNDGNTCTVDTCNPSGLCTFARTAGCCVTAADCADPDDCTTNTCNAGSCATAVVPGCCNYGFACNDAQTTTQDVCSGEGGTCSNPLYPSCVSNTQCDDGDTCTVDACAVGGQCSHARTPNCCTTTADCNDGRSCTVDTCGGGTCSHTPTANCCDTAADCDDGVTCTLDQCLGNSCAHVPTPNCCTSTADCVSNDPCVTQTCNAQNRCVGNPAANCCTFGFQCDDRNACTADTCQGAQCAHAPNGACCVTASDCTGGNACTTASCDGMGRCQYAPVGGCCLQDQDCADADVCTQDTCNNNTCGHTAIPSCCHNAGECPNTNPCLTMACTGNVCVGAPVTGCCNAAADCNDGNVCTTDACTNNSCTFGDVPGCCNVDPDCADADACTADTCVSNACVHAPITACCTSAAQCNDGNSCTTDGCTNNVCTATLVPGCCLTATECDDTNPCTADACTNAACTNTAVTGCCITAADCADQNACTTDSCQNNVCVNAAVAGCCAIDQECDDGDSCTQDTCAQAVCAHQAIAGCGADAGSVGMDGSVVGVDASMVGMDASVVGVDASVVGMDAAVRVDAGGGRDGAVASGDGGPQSPDGSVVVVMDAGGGVTEPPPGEEPKQGFLRGCVCAAPGETPGVAAGLLVLGWMVARRKRRG